MSNISGDKPNKGGSLLSNLTAKASEKIKETGQAAAKAVAAKPKAPVSVADPAQPGKRVARAEMALEQAQDVRTRDREASKELTKQQSSLAADLTGPIRSETTPDRAFWALERSQGGGRGGAEQESAATDNDEESRTSGLLPGLVERVTSEVKGRVTEVATGIASVLGLSGEDRGLTSEEERQARQALEGLSEEERREALAPQIEQAQARISEGETPEQQAELLAQEIDRAGFMAPDLISAVGPGLLAVLEDAEPETVSNTIRQFSEIAEGNPAATDLLATQLSENPPGSFSGVVDGLATASAQGDSSLALAFAQKLEEAEAPVASQVRAAAELGEAVREIGTELSSGDLPGTVAATDRITEALDGAPPEVARALIGQLEANGDLQRLIENLGNSASRPSDGLRLVSRGGESIDLLTHENLGDFSNGDLFARGLAGLTNAVSLANDPAITDLVASRVVDGIGHRKAELEQALELGIAGGHGAALAGSIARQVFATDPGFSAKIVEAVERGAEGFLNRLDRVADRVDVANGDLAYLLANWGPLFGDSEEGQAALAREIEAFQAGHPEYEELNRLSANIGGNLEAFRELQGLFPDKQFIKDRERDLLLEVPRFGGTENGQRVLAEAIMRSGQGEQSFLDRYQDDDILSRVNSSFLENNGFDSVEEFHAQIGQNALTGSLVRMAEATQEGDHDTIAALESGLLQQAPLLGEERDNLNLVLSAMADVRDFSAEARGPVGTGDFDDLDAALRILTNRISALNNPATATKFRVGGAALSLVAVGSAWFQGERELNRDTLIQSSVPALEALFGGGELAANFLGSSSNLFSRGAKGFAALGIALDGYSLVEALNQGNPAQAGISALGVAGGVATLAGATGVGLVLSAGAIAVGLGYAQYGKVQASNRYESAEARAFIGAALEQAGVENEKFDEVVRHLSNADSDGRQIGILIQQAAERAGMEPQEMLAIIGSLPPGEVLNIVEAGHGVDPTGNDLHSLIQANPEIDRHVGTSHLLVNRSRTVEGFLIYLEQRGVIDR